MTIFLYCFPGLYGDNLFFYVHHPPERKMLYVNSRILNTICTHSIRLLSKLLVWRDDNADLSMMAFSLTSKINYVNIQQDNFHMQSRMLT